MKRTPCASGWTPRTLRINRLTHTRRHKASTRGYVGGANHMLLAKLALGLCGTVALAGVYTFHEGVMRVDEDHYGGRHVHVWVPAAIVPMALHVVPGRHLERALEHAGPWLPTLRALTKELKKYPEAE